MVEILIDKLIAFAMVLGGLSIQPNPKADGADALLRYAVPEAELVGMYDGKVLVVDNYPAFVKLADSPALAKLPGARDQLRAWIATGEQVRAMGKQTWGMDPLEMQRSSFIMFVDLPDRDGVEPRYLLAGRSTLPIEVVGVSMAPRGGAEIAIDGRRAFRTPSGEVGGITKDGYLIVGTAEWAMPRLSDGWKPPPRPRGSALAAIGAALDERPFFLFASMPSPALVERARTMVDGFPADLYAGHALAAVWATSTGVSWTYHARDAELAKRVELASTGAVEVLRALHVAPRSALDLASAALPSYAGRHQAIDAVIAAEPQLRTALASVGGDGRFKARVTRDGTRVTAVLRGKKVSDVVPVTALAMLVSLGVLTDDDDGELAEDPVTPGSPPPPPPAPASGRRDGRPPPGPRPATPPATAPRPRGP